MDQKQGKRVLFIDRDGTIIKEYPPTYQIDSLEKVTFYPFTFKYLGKIAQEMDYELVMVSNQDGLGTPAFPESDFWPAHNLVVTSFENEGVFFKNQLIDRSYPGRICRHVSRVPVCSPLTSTILNTTSKIHTSLVIGSPMCN